MTEQDHTVASIFARAERVFERRVDQLLALKRAKARAAGTPFNARKAKRDARTVAGREKLDALVRRLADLAALQEKALGLQHAKKQHTQLDSAAAALIGFAALAETSTAASRLQSEQQQHDCHHHTLIPALTDHHASISPTPAASAVPGPGPVPVPDVTDFPDFTIPYSPSPPYVSAHDVAMQISPLSTTDFPTVAYVRQAQVARIPTDESDPARDVLDTSSCSDDASMTGPLHSLKDIREALDTEVGEPAPTATNTTAAAPAVPHDSIPVPNRRAKSDRHLFHATQSVVNFVLEADDDPHHHNPNHSHHATPPNKHHPTQHSPHPAQLQTPPAPPMYRLQHHSPQPYTDRYDYHQYGSRTLAHTNYDPYESHTLSPSRLLTDWAPHHSNPYPLHSPSSL